MISNGFENVPYSFLIISAFKSLILEIRMKYNKSQNEKKFSNERKNSSDFTQIRVQLMFLTWHENDLSPLRNERNNDELELPEGITS